MTYLLRNNKERLSIIRAIISFSMRKKKKLVGLFPFKEIDNTVYLKGKKSQLTSRLVWHMAPLYLMALQHLKIILMCHSGATSYIDILYKPICVTSEKEKEFR